jgi:hypothetical protein
MKSPFPATPNWNYERMALAAIAAATSIAMGLVFGSAALQAAAWLPGTWDFPPQVRVLQLWALVLTSSTLLSVGIAFVCFTVIKISPRNHQRYYSLRRWIRNFGLVWLRIAVLLGGLWVIVNVALQLMR